MIFADGLERAVPVSSLLLAFTVPLSYAVANSFIKKRLDHLAAVPLTCVALAASSALLVPLAVVEWQVATPQPASPDEWRLAISSLLVLGVLGTGLATYLFNKLVLDQGPLFAGMVTYLVPLGAVVWGLADGEQITGKQMLALGGVLVMVGVVQYRSATPVVRRRSATVDRIACQKTLAE